MRNAYRILPLEECQDKSEPTNEDNSVLLSFDHVPNKRRQKKQSAKHNKQPKAYITDEQYEEPLEQRKALITLGRRKYSTATKF